MALICSDCGKAYPLVDGIPCFGDSDTFYEGRWAQPDSSAGSLRNRLVKKERFFVNGLRGRRGRILDLGCGGGWRLFATVGHSVGIDISLASLQSARRLYDQVAQARLTAFPFADESFDFVVSSDVLGHIPLTEKDATLSEIYRVLKPGGLTWHYVEADGDDPLMRFAKGYPELYTRHIVEPEGHIGLEPAGSAAARFERAGFRIAGQVPCYRGLTYVGRFVQYFDNGFKERSLFIRLLVLSCKLATIAGPIELAANLGMSFLIELGDRILPERWAGGLLICCEKP
ncbi:MAG: methyltransferase domain-containing protein [Chloroflexi bacterium]|nr:methyltransferase domain-containing protein [Chloroflexota bacterium]